MEIDKLAGLVSEYGLPVILISIITIFLIGTLKYFGVFKKIQNDNIKKAIYYGLDILLSFGITALYYVIFGLFILKHQTSSKMLSSCIWAPLYT